MSLKIQPRAWCNDRVSYSSPEVVDTKFIFSVMGKSGTSAHRSELFNSGFGRCDAWYAAVIGNLIGIS